MKFKIIKIKWNIYSILIIKDCKIHDIYEK